MRGAGILLALLSATGCAHRPAVVTARNPYSYALTNACSAALFQRFVDGDPIDKVGAARLMADNDCEGGVALILDDIRALGASYRCDQAALSDDVRDDKRPSCTVVWKGTTVPYIDYHTPLFDALIRLTGIGYFEPDTAWFAAIDDWVAARPK